MENSENTDVSELRAKLMALLGEDKKYYPTQIEERFPRILVQIVAQWGKPELDGYLNELMLPNRPGRQGFPPAIAMEIFHLVNLHSALNLTPQNSGTGWSGVDNPEQFKKALQRED
ncbi:MAG TPA: hypothetical protein VN639_15195 [Azonexus sp.]|nr:hypothetical protein [Azonexus sp.]